MTFRFYLFFIALLACKSFAASFDAEVSSSSISMNDSVTLILTLHDAKSNDTPNINSLKNSFKILSSQAYSSIQVIQWSQTSTKSWEYQLLPKQSGTVTIPSFTIKTNEGQLSTEQVTLEILQSHSGQGNDTSVSPIESNIVLLDDTNGYVLNQPILFNLIISEKSPVLNLKLEQPQSNDFLLEQVTQPNKSYKTNQNGENFSQTSIGYMLTPLVSGSIELPTFVISGYKNSASNNNFSDPFGNMPGFSQNGIFSNLEPFALQNDVVKVDILPSNPKVSPWLPAEEITIDDKWETQGETIQAGDSITRKITIKATGALSSNLPTAALMSNTNAYKVYQDKNVTNQKFSNGKIYSSIIQTYTIIPTVPGKLHFPSRKISWWDTKNLKIRTHVLNEKKYTAVTSTPITQAPIPQALQQSISLSKGQVDFTFTQILLMIVILCLVVLILTIFYVLRKNKHPTNKSTPANLNHIVYNLTSLESAKSLEQLTQKVQDYFVNKYQVPANTSVGMLSLHLRTNYHVQNVEKLEKILECINAAKYHEQQVDFVALKSNLIQIISDLTLEKKTASYKNENLNPS